jgi:ArsR family transcriptional regulator
MTPRAQGKKTGGTRGSSGGSLTRCCAPRSATRVAPAAAVRHAALFRALGEASRLEILGLLAAADGPICACEIEEHFRLAQPTVSHHLRVLREAGLVTAERRGLWVHYTLDAKALAVCGEFIARLG